MVLQGKKILVTGGAGFIGSNLVESLLPENEVVVIDNLRTGRISNLEGLNVEFINVDIRDLESLRNVVEDVDVIYHLAAMASVVDSFNNVLECEEINIRGTLNLLELCRLHDIPRFIFTSSAAVYGNNLELPKREDMIPDLPSPYAASKQFGETLSKIYWENYSIQTLSLRNFNVFGPKQDPSNPYSGVISIFLDRALKNQDIIIYGNGETTRDFIYISDVCTAYHYATEANSHFGESFNISTNKETSILQLAEMVISMTESQSKILFQEERIGDIRHSVADNSKAKEVFGWAPQVSFEEGLQALVKWYTGRY